MNVYNKIYPYLPSLNVTNFNRFVLGAVGLGAYLTVGAPLAILSMGACYYLKEQVLARMPSAQVVQGSSRNVTVSNELSVSLKRKNPQAAQISNQGNCCFCSSVLWSFFANEPVVARELPLAIARKLNDPALLPELRLTWRQKMLSFVDVYDFSQVLGILNKKTSLGQSDLNTLRTSLQGLEQKGLLGGEKGRKARELLSLLELHDIIQEFQKTPSMKGSRVNDMRNIVARVNNTFDATGTKTGDAQEVFQAIADLIFEKSKVEQSLFTGNRSKIPNWGDFMLPLEPQEPVRDIFLREYQGYEFSKAPEFLALGVKRYDEKGALHFDPVIADTEFTLPMYQNGGDPEYELVGVSRRLPGIAHYDAFWKQEDAWYYGNDLKSPSVQQVDVDTVWNEARTGYLFFYRKK